MNKTLIMTVLIAAGTAGELGAYTNASFSFTSGFSTSPAVSASYKTETSVGQIGGAPVESMSYRSYPGLLPAFIVINDVIITFMDESPSSSEMQATTSLMPKITVESSGGNGIASVKYRISNSGPEDVKFFAWQTDVTTDTVISPTKAVFRATLPNAAGQFFSQSDNNYIQWRVKNSANYESISSKYRIRVIANDAPVVTILQPDEKGGMAGMQPQIQARIMDNYWGIDATGVEARLEGADGMTLYTARSATRPGIYTPSTNILSFQYDGTPLVPGNSYKLTVTALDRAGVSGSASMTFKVMGGAIADLVPYPSPFDPRVQPVTIRYVLNKKADVSVNLYDMSGRLVKALVDNRTKEAGINEETWTGANYAGETLANGVYFCEIVAKDSEGEHRRYTSLAIFGK